MRRWRDGRRGGWKEGRMEGGKKCLVAWLRHEKH